MKNVVISVAVVCITGCSIPISTHIKPVSTAPAKHLYTDSEAQAFLRSLPTIEYPTTILAACTRLGIELGRLGVDTTQPIHDQLGGPGTGVTMYHVAPLSDSYSIAFLHNISDDAPVEYRIYKVDIWKSNDREE